MSDSLIRHFRLTAHPFGRDASPSALHRHRGFTEAHERLRYTIELDGLSALVSLKTIVRGDNGEAGACPPPPIRAPLSQLVEQPAYPTNGQHSPKRPSPRVHVSNAILDETLFFVGEVK